MSETMVLYVRVSTANGRTRTVPVSLPFVEGIADLPAYQAPAMQAFVLPEERRGVSESNGYAWVTRRARKLQAAR